MRPDLNPLLCVSVLVGLLRVGLAAGGDSSDYRPHGGMLLYPDVSATHVVFEFANDLWLVPREGGLAVPLASPPGRELFPRFSPDGRTIAFIGNYDGNRDVYTVPTEGGVPKRITHHPAGETLCDWTPDGQRLIYYARGVQDYPRAQELFWVSAEGGLPEKLPVPYGANGSLDATGTWLAYTPHSRDFRTWKRYRGGMATDIWLFNLKTHESRRITTWEGTDTFPMWHGRRVYYLSDAGSKHKLNIWVYDLDSGDRRQVTHFDEFDCKWPAIGPDDGGPGTIVFQNGPDLYLLDLASEKATRLEVRIPGARPKLRPKRVDASNYIFRVTISPTGKRVVASARGDIWTLPAHKGSQRNLTRTNGVAERQPKWSPDGKWIAYFSDATGEYELYITRSDGRGETRQLTHDGGPFKFNPTWSPNSKYIAFWEKTGKLFLYDLEHDTLRHIDTEPWANHPPLNFSPDSRWIAYPKIGDNLQHAIWLYDIEHDKLHQVTSGFFEDTWPTFDRKGEFLYFVSARDFSSPIYEDIGTTFVYANLERLYAVPLKADQASPLLPTSDEEEIKSQDEDKNKDKGKDEDQNQPEKGNKDATDHAKPAGNESAGGDDQSGDEGSADRTSQAAASQASKPASEDQEAEETKPVEIDLEGFEARAIQLPVPRGRFTRLAVNDKNQLVYGRTTAQAAGGEDSIRLFDIHADEPKEQTVVSGTAVFVASRDGRKLLVIKGPELYVVDAAAGQTLDKPVPTDAMIVWIDPRTEWRQIFIDAWRIERDFFYDPHMHGVDWLAVRRRYEKMLADCQSREDVGYVIGEMISELNVGHAYYWGGDTEPTPSVSVGMPGCDFALENGAYRIKRIYRGADWDADAVGPLAQPGVDVHEGDYLLAVNGTPVDTTQDPWAAFQGLANKLVTLTVSSKPQLDEDARDVVVKLPASERRFRFRAWIEKNRRYVEEQTGGRVGYIYVPDTGVNGQNELFRQFYGQRDKQALIIDERWNGGGQVPTRFIELLNRPRTNYWARRDGRDWPWPPDSHVGPKCMLINGLAGSGGDAFPAYFRNAGLGKLIGTRTWGGLVGISGNPVLIDRGYTSVPTFGYYELNGTWGIEGHGVDPDIEVIDDPAKMVGGRDPQLDAAIKLMLHEIETNGFHPPRKPPYPDRSGMGIREEDK